MSELPTTKNELLSEIVLDDEIEHVRDIGIDKKYGIGLSGSVLHEGEEISVLGSVVLEPDTGDAVLEDEGTAIHAYPDGLVEKGVELLNGEEAVEAVAELCRHNGISDPFQREDDVDISPDAR